MATLNIRGLSDEVHQRLRLRAARNGRSMEAEARGILAESLAADELMTPEALQAWVAGLYRGRPPTGVVDELLAERRAEAARE